MNLAEQSRLPAESEENADFSWISSWHPGAIVHFSPNKYIDRIEIEFPTEETGREFHYLCEELWWGHRFFTENVRWCRFDGYLAVIGATFVRWKPVED